MSLFLKRCGELDLTPGSVAGDGDVAVVTIMNPIVQVTTEKLLKLKGMSLPLPSKSFPLSNNVI